MVERLVELAAFELKIEVVVLVAGFPINSF